MQSEKKGRKGWRERRELQKGSEGDLLGRREEGGEGLSSTQARRERRIEVRRRSLSDM